MDSKPAAYAAVLGRNLAVARIRLDRSQEDVAERMRNLGFAAWARATVSKSERGSRPVTAVEVIGLAVALETTTGALMVPFDERQEVQLQGDGPSFAVKSLAARVTGHNDRSVTWDGNKPVFGVGKSAWFAGDPDAPDVVKARWAVAEDEP